MIIVMKPDVSPASPLVQRILDHTTALPGVTAHVRVVPTVGRSVTEINVTDRSGALTAQRFADLPGVARVVGPTHRFHAIGRHGDGLDAVSFEYNGVQFSQDTFHVFAGLCAVDTREHVEAMFQALQSHGLVTTRAGAYKPRTSPYEFQGHGARCLPYLFELAGRYGIRVIAMEVTHEAHVDEILAALAATGHATGVMLQIGTRNAQNFELLKAVGRQTELPVLYKRGMGITLDESLNACEYLAAGGNHRIVFGLRGIKSHLGEPHRNLVDFAHVPVVKRLSRLPVCIDPSHSVGGRGKGADGLLEIQQATAQGVIAGANMVLVDFHPRPEVALCDGGQALRLDELPHYLEDVALVRASYRARIALAERHAAPAAEPAPRRASTSP
jgi:3-deoxy-7-phosphoheptulonate synthase